MTIDATPKPADIDWQTDNSPYASQFEDIYFSTENGLAETQHVFLHHNQLPARWQAMDTSIPFVILETGFGTGLNFLATCEAFIQHAPPQARLQFISIEKFPLTKYDLSRALGTWESLKPYGEKLLNHYPGLVTGCHRLHIDERITLDLWYGDVIDILPQITPTACVHAWYLDGFAPSKNPAMWRDDLYQMMQQLSAPTATFSTFTAAGKVRRGLIAAGFEVKKVAGFGRKREMLCGQLADLSSNKKAYHAPWFSPVSPSFKEKQNKAIIIGAGVTGATLTYQLARRGWSCQVIDQYAAPASAGSSNRQGAVYPLLTSQWRDLSTQFYLMSYLYSLRHIKQLKARGYDTNYHACGLILTATTAKERQSLQKKINKLNLPEDIIHSLNSTLVQQQTGGILSDEALFFPQAGWVSPVQFVQQNFLAAEQLAPINYQFETCIEEIKREEGEWRVYDKQGQCVAQAATVIFATAYEIKKFDIGQSLPLSAIRGQVTYPPANTVSQHLKSVICYDGYITPADEGLHSMGASYDTGCETIHVTTDENQQNIAQLEELSPTLAKTWQQNTPPHFQANAGIRCSSLDHLPLIGHVPDYQACKEVYHDLAKGKPFSNYPSLPIQQGLYMAVAQGSRGLTTAAFTAELLAAQINNEVLPLPQTLYAALSPQRFLIRALKKGQLE